MSLIQQALERAQANPHTAALEREQLEIKRPSPTVTPEKEEMELQVLEEKIESQKIKPAKKVRQKPLLKGVFIVIYLLVILGGVLGIYFWMQNYSGTSTSLETINHSPVAVNPVKSLVVPGKSNTALVLTGITNSGGVRYALINNQVVTIGDMMKKENSLIKDIHERSVIIEQNGRPLTLSLDSNT